MSDRLVQASFLGSRKARVDVLFVGEAPGREEHRRGFAFVEEGASGRMIRQLIEHELPGKYVQLDNACPRWLGAASNKPNAEILREFAEYHQQMIETAKPRAVVLLGKYAQMAFKLGGKVVERCGKVESINGIPAVLSVHPAYVLRSPDQIELLRRVFSVLKSCLGKDPTGLPIKRVEPDAFLSWLWKNRNLLSSFDIETTGLDPLSSRMETAAVRIGRDVRWISFRDSTAKEYRDQMTALGRWWSQGPRIVHNVRFEGRWMTQHCGGEVAQDVWDTMLLAHMYDERTPKGLDYLLPTYLNIKPYWTHLPRKGDYTGVDTEDLGNYNAQDAWYTWELKEWLESRLPKKVRECYDNIFRPLDALLCTMRQRGVYIDQKSLETLLKGQRSRVGKQTIAVHKVFPDLNVQSPKQMQELVYKTLRIKPHPRFMTGKGQPSCDSDALEFLSQKHPELKPLALLRKEEYLLQLYETFKKLSERTGCLHTNLRVSTVTCRLSSSDPNLQNQNREGPQRQVMRSRWKGGWILQADYNQHEMRVFASLGECLAMLAEFQKKGADLHTLTMEQMRKLGVVCDRVDAKRVNFGILYDITAEGLYVKSNIPKERGREMLDTWHKAFPELKQLHRQVDKSFRTQGYVENPFGIRRRLNDPSNGHERRQGYNFPIQSTAVMCSYIAMLLLEKEMRKRNMKSLLILQIHDSVVIDVAPGEKQMVTEMVHRVMVGGVKKHLPIDIPIAVDVKVKEHF